MLPWTKGKKYSVTPSPFEGEQVNSKNAAPNDSGEAVKRKGKGFTLLKSLAEQYGVDRERPKVAATFSTKEQVTFKVDQMKLNEFIHHVFGGVLGVNYVVHTDLTGKLDPVTLNFHLPISKKEAFVATSEVLTGKQIGVSYKDNVYYLFPMETSASGDIAIGVGRNDTDLPLVGNQILQIVPMNYGVTIGVERDFASAD